MYAGCPLQNVSYDAYYLEDGSVDRHEWIDAKPGLKALNPLINLPYVKDGNVIVSQSNACFLYLGRKLGMLGASQEGESKTVWIVNFHF